jgi:hypothetical protein
MAPIYVYSISVTTSFVDELNKELLQFPRIDHLTFPTLLSALQFMEQKPPAMVVVHGEDYPRHWKILSQLLDPNTTLVVYHKKELDPKEQKKADALKVRIVNKLDKSFFLNQLPEDTFEQLPINTDQHIDQPFLKLLLVNTGKRLLVLETLAINKHALKVKQIPESLPTTFTALLVDHISNNSESESLDLINPIRSQSSTTSVTSEHTISLFFLQ